MTNFLPISFRYREDGRLRVGWCRDMTTLIDVIHDMELPMNEGRQEFIDYKIDGQRFTKDHKRK